MVAATFLAGALALAGLAAADKSKSPETPSKYRLAYYGSDGMTVSWATHKQINKPTVLYGTDPNKLKQRWSSTDSRTYNATSVWSNHVSIQGLQPNTTYYYQVEHAPKEDVFSFKTARAPDALAEHTVAVVVDLGAMGDYGLSDHLPAKVDNALQPGEVNTIQRLVMQQDDFDFILHPGDISYADYWLKESVLGYLNGTVANEAELYDAIDQAFFDEISEVARSKPYHVGPGNHEANCDNGGYKNYTESICIPALRNFLQYRQQWKMPSDLVGGQGNFWYSMDVGGVHYLMFDTETDLGHGLIGADEIGGAESFEESPVGSYADAQYDFIKKDLSSVDRQKTPWVIALGHRPWYTAGADGDQYWNGQAAFEQLFIDNGVDVVLHGHVHNVQRSYPIANNVTDPNGYDDPKAPMYIVNGAAGHFDGLDSLVYPLPEWTAFANDTLYSYSTLTFHNRTHMTHTALASKDNSVIDQVTLYKSHKA